jgi:hypothetical protein
MSVIIESTMQGTVIDPIRCSPTGLIERHIMASVEQSDTEYNFTHTKIREEHHAI